MTDPIAGLTAALADTYRIERHLGEGGMATVYLAHDLKHDRKVAVKVLRPELAAIVGGDRFLAEIKVTANLQHPNILPLYDSGKAGTSPEYLYYVMPYVEDETLRGRMMREKQLPVEETVAIVKDVADALHFAHEQGIVHRDIKPENILLQRGKPLVADFGIALAVSQAGGSRLTETGLSLGTPHYMSPEQAAGDRALDARSDIYALGAMAYEMLVGEPPHIGASVQAVVARILSDTPTPITRSRSMVPPNVDAAIQKSLAKSPADRFTSAAKFSEALSNPAFTLGIPSATADQASGRTKQRTRIFAGLAAVLGLLALWGWLRPRPEPALQVSRFSVAMPDDQALMPFFLSRLAISPDGSRLVYRGPSRDGAGQQQLWLRSLSQLEATPLPGTEGAGEPFFSPDGSRVAYILARRGGASRVEVVSLGGGPPLTVADSGVEIFGGSWGPDGLIYLSGPNGLATVPATGGVPTAFTTIDTSQNESGHIRPEVLPNGKGVLFVVVGRGGLGGDLEEADVAVADRATGQHRILTRGILARYATSGHLVYVTANGTLMAAPFDQDRMELTGDAVSLVEGLSTRFVGSVDLALSSTGTLVYTTGVTAQSPDELVWVTRDGVATEVEPGWTGRFTTLALSPDDTRLAVSIQSEAETQLWVKQLDRGPLSKLTFEGSLNLRPAWRPDGQEVYFQSNRDEGDQQFYAKRADGSAVAELLLDRDQGLQEIETSRDGRWIVFRESAPGTGDWGDLYAMRPGEDSAPTPLLTTEFPEFHPALSPDGRWLAYGSNESGQREVYVRPFPNAGDAKWQISTGGGEQPLWAHSGRELFYRSPTAMNSVEVLPGPTFATGAQRTLFPTTAYRGLGARNRSYDVTSDDQRFIMVRLRGAEQGAGELIVVQNWFEELKAIR